VVRGITNDSIITISFCFGEKTKAYEQYFRDFITGIQVINDMFKTISYKHGRLFKVV